MSSEAAKERRRESVARYRAKNRETERKRAAGWRAANPERNRAMHMIISARKNAAKKGVPFDLDGRQADLQKIIAAGGCHYTGLPFNLTGGLTWDSPSLDRVVPEKGYVWENVRVVLYCINAFKGTEPLEKMCFIATHLIDWQAAKKARLENCKTAEDGAGHDG